jgi:hypothetical protein
MHGGDVTESPVQRDDPLLEEMAQAMNDEKKSAPKIAEQLAKIINSRWLNKLRRSIQKSWGVSTKKQEAKIY